MKTISAGLDAHLRQEVTTLCTCWKIVRTDGQVFGFTDHDQDITFGGLTYESETGYTRTAIRSDAQMSVDNLDVQGFLESDRISENDLRNGVFDFAKVYIFALNWADTSQAEIKLRRGWFGEVVLNENGMFETEIRGLHQALSQNYMESYQPECRADFCDQRCKLSIATYTRTGYVWSFTGRNQFRISTTPDLGVVATVGAHRYWKFTGKSVTSGNYMSMAEIRFFDAADAEILGGTASTTGSIYGAGYEPDKARDNNAGTIYHTGADNLAGPFIIDFGSAKDVRRLSIQARNTNPEQATRSFDMHYSDDGVTWVKAGSFTTGTWTVGQVKSFTGWTPSVFTQLPAPATGATTYLGGTVKFTSGPNTGRVMEIVAFDEATGTVTAFENFPYEISVGDQLEIAQGCDKMFATCKLYQNVNNFRAEPHVPGQDELMKYPDAPAD